MRLKRRRPLFDFLFTPAVFKRDLGGMLMALNRPDCADKGGSLHKRPCSLRVIEMAIHYRGFYLSLFLLRSFSTPTETAFMEIKIVLLLCLVNLDALAG